MGILGLALIFLLRSDFLALCFPMRPLRLLAPCDPEYGFPVLYHITSRVVEKRHIFKDRERAKFLKLAKDFAVFSGFELASWCLMSNHFHLLVRVPVQDVDAISDAEMIERLSRILSPTRLNRIIARLDGATDPDERGEILACFRKRIGHLPSYVKAVKQEFSQWFNHVNRREGTLWERRYHSTIIEDTGGENPATELNGAGEIARIVASYIDMNPVRAGLETDPEDSDWSSYGAAIRGDTTAIRGLRVLWGSMDEIDVSAESGRSVENADQQSHVTNQRYVSTHRRWLLRGEDTTQTIESAAATADTAQTGTKQFRPPGHPRRILGLSGIRILGSPGFQSRFGVTES